MISPKWAKEAKPASSRNDSEIIYPQHLNCISKFVYYPVPMIVNENASIFKNLNWDLQKSKLEFAAKQKGYVYVCSRLQNMEFSSLTLTESLKCHPSTRSQKFVNKPWASTKKTSWMEQQKWTSILCPNAKDPTSLLVLHSLTQLKVKVKNCKMSRFQHTLLLQHTTPLSFPLFSGYTKKYLVISLCKGLRLRSVPMVCAEKAGGGFNHAVEKTTVISSNISMYLAS